MGLGLHNWNNGDVEVRKNGGVESTTALAGNLVAVQQIQTSP